MTISETAWYSFRHSYDKRASRLAPTDVTIRSEELPLGPAPLDGPRPVSLPAPFSPAGTPLAELATLLYAGAGIRSVELIDSDPAGIVLHRTTPAPGGMSAVELFAVLSGAVFSYSAHRHQLLPLRDADAGRAGSPAIAVCIHPDRLAGKYTNFAPRLALLQAGHAIGAIENAANALGLRSSWRRDAGLPRPAGLECLSRLDIEPGTDRPRPSHLEREIRSRTSGDLAATGTPWYRHDLDEATTADFLVRVARSARPNIELLCVAARVAEPVRGTYHYDHDTKQFVRSPIADEPPVSAFGNRKYVTADSFSLIFVLLTDFSAAFAEVGTRHYAELNLACGAVAQGICLTAAAHGLAARPLCDFDERVLDGWLGADFAGLTPAYVVVVAPARRPTEYPVDWS